MLAKYKFGQFSSPTPEIRRIITEIFLPKGRNKNGSLVYRKTDRELWYYNESE
jgi:hypothetical protein